MAGLSIPVRPTLKRDCAGESLFLLEKQMLKLKNVQAVEFFITKEGKIGIKQDSVVLGKSVEVYITHEQFEHLQIMVTDFEIDILDLWNQGVDSE